MNQDVRRPRRPRSGGLALAVGYFSVPPGIGWIQGREFQAQVEWIAASQGLALAAICEDVRGVTVTGWHRARGALVEHRSVLLVIPGLEHVDHDPMFEGLDKAGIVRILRARILTGPTPGVVNVR